MIQDIYMLAAYIDYYALILMFTLSYIRYDIVLSLIDAIIRSYATAMLYAKSAILHS